MTYRWLRVSATSCLAERGLFLATLTGPGKIWLQRMPVRNLRRGDTAVSAWAAARVTSDRRGQSARLAAGRG